MDIQWYPGHMVKAQRLVKENLQLVDVVVELVDARIPSSSRNPRIDEIISAKPRCIVLNKADLANNKITKEWENYFLGRGHAVAQINSLTGQGLKNVINKIKQLAEPKLAKLKEKGILHRPAKVMVVGIPNVGKSSFINKLVGKTTAKTGNKPGVTKGKQWIKLKNNIELLDTPGILWPKFEDPKVGLHLAFTGSIKEEILDIEQLSVKLLEVLLELDPVALKDRYKLNELVKEPVELLQLIGSKRGCLVSGGIVDTLKAAIIVLDEFQSGKIGMFSLERPNVDV